MAESRQISAVISITDSDTDMGRACCVQGIWLIDRRTRLRHKDLVSQCHFQICVFGGGCPCGYVYACMCVCMYVCMSEDKLECCSLGDFHLTGLTLP